MTREQILARQNELLNGARTAGRAMTAEEIAEFDALQRMLENIPETAAENHEDTERAVAAERERIGEITDLARSFDLDPADAIKDGSTVDQYRAHVLEQVKAQSENSGRLVEEAEKKIAESEKTIADSEKSLAETEVLIKEAEAKQAEGQESREKLRLKRAELSEKLSGLTVNTTIKTGAGGRAFGSISSKEIAEECKNQHGITLDKKKIVLDDAIKAPGTYNVQIKLHPQVTGTLSVKVTEA